MNKITLTHMIYKSPLCNINFSFMVSCHMTTNWLLAY